jgi:TIR domain
MEYEMKSQSRSVFVLPQKLEKIFASLAIYYGKGGKTDLQRLLINSKYSVREETSYDNWNGGTYGHTVDFQVPPILYFEVFDDLTDVQKTLCQDINKLVNIENEFIDEVVCELREDSSLENWRENSGLLLHETPLKIPSSSDDLARIWRPGFLRMFVSHKSEHKKEASDLKAKLLTYGISCFVAHEDIEPTQEWQDEIERALFSAHLMVLLLTDEFHHSNWTDQEIGVAIGRGIPIIPIRLGTDPYGFIGKFQALSGYGKACHKLATEIVQIVGATQQLTDTFNEALLIRFEYSESYDQANTVFKMLEERLAVANPQVITRLEEAPDGNSQVREAWEVKRRLLALLQRLRKS